MTIHQAPPWRMPDAAFDALATHSHIVLNGIIHENPHYMPPREFRRFIAKRRSGPGPVRAGADG